MGNCCGSSGKSKNHVDVRPSSPGGPMTPKTSSSTGTKLSSSLSLTSSITTITASSSSGGGSFMGIGSTSASASTSTSTGSGGASNEAAVYHDPEGRILGAPNLRTFTFTELRAATKNFKPDTVLGEGGFGRVYKGWVDEKTLNPAKPGSGMIVAIKKLKPESMQGYEEWQSEIHFLGRLSHPNLVKLLGYCWEERELLLVYEFMAKGSLENHLFRRGSAPLSWEVRLKIAIGAARGLAFLHASEKQKVIYRDFKAANILLDANYSAKLSDFGLAKLGPTDSKSHVTTRVMGTNGYAAPEYVATGHLYVKSDVYGFGVLLLEMLSGERALDANRPSSQEKLVDWAKPYLNQLLANNGRRKQQLARLMDPRLEGKYNSKQALQAAQLTLGCLAAEPKSRPSMNQVLETLQQIESTPPGRRRRHDREHHNVSTHSSVPVLHRRQRQENGHAGSRAS